MKWIWWLLVVIVVLAVGWWIWSEMNKPLIGQTVEDIGRDHTQDISGVIYNSNPPTSGPHFSVWAKSGVYDRVLSDGYLIHSLEHGYVVLNYNCDKLKIKSSKLKVEWKVYAHETDEFHDEPVSEGTPSGKPLTKMTIPAGVNWFTQENPPIVEVELPESFKSEECKQLVNELSGFLKSFQRLIIVPRIDLDAPIALTAWGRIEKLNSLDKKLIKQFIQVYHNRGPEKTME